MWRFLSRILGSATDTAAAGARSALPQRLQQDSSDSGTLHRPRLTICVEGNIGSGKTTLLEHFASYPDVEVTREDVAGWCDVKGHNLLHMAYENPSRWSHLLQTHIQLSLAEGHARGVSGGSKVKLMERSIHSARYCFLENLHRSGQLSEPEYLVSHVCLCVHLYNYCLTLTKEIASELHKIVHILTSVKIIGQG